MALQRRIRRGQSLQFVCMLVAGNLGNWWSDFYNCFTNGKLQRPGLRCRLACVGGVVPELGEQARVGAVHERQQAVHHPLQRAGAAPRVPLQVHSLAHRLPLQQPLREIRQVVFAYIQLETLATLIVTETPSTNSRWRSNARLSRNKSN